MRLFLSGSPCPPTPPPWHPFLIGSQCPHPQPRHRHPPESETPGRAGGLKTGAAQSGLHPCILNATITSRCFAPLILWALSRLTAKLHFGRARLCPSRNIWAHTEVRPPSHYANHPFPPPIECVLSFSLPTQSIAIDCSKSQTLRASPAEPVDLLLDFNNRRTSAFRCWLRLIRRCKSLSARSGGWMRGHPGSPGRGQSGV